MPGWAPSASSTIRSTHRDRSGRAPPLPAHRTLLRRDLDGAPALAAPRRHLLSLIGAHPGATVVDVGCGTGLNFAGLRELVGPTGHIVGIDASQSILAAAQRRIDREGWTDVTTVHGDLGELLAVLRNTDSTSTTSTSTSPPA